MMKGLPVGLDNFEDFSRLGSIYVDKTAYIHKMMISGGKTFFLSRPRRFGKSLLLSTMQAVFEGRKELFKGLFIEDKIEWEAHPVIKLDMSAVDTMSIDAVRKSMLWKLEDISRRLGLEINLDLPGPFLARMISELYERSGKQVVVLIDEYDKPILDTIENPAMAVEVRQFLQQFYVVLKASGNMLRFLMITGVSKINPLSIFSGLNQLSDITLNPDFAEVCGYTQRELEQHFDPHVTRLASFNNYTQAKTYEQIKHWYNGYSWDGVHFVYNPFSVLRLFQERRFMAHWFATGTPTFLLKLLRKMGDYSPVLNESVWEDYGFETQQTLENLKLAPLLFQTGYLTIKSDNPDQSKFELRIPNEEVRKAMLESLVNDYIRHAENSNLYRLAGNLKNAFSKGDTVLAIEYLKVLYSSSSYHQGIDNEGYYHNLFEIFCKFAGMDILIESRTDIGRIDSVIRLEDRTYIIEIKHSPAADGLPAVASQALAQIRRNNYTQPYLHQGKAVHLLGLAFTKGGLDFREDVV